MGYRMGIIYIESSRVSYGQFHQSVYMMCCHWGVFIMWCHRGSLYVTSLWCQYYVFYSMYYMWCHWGVLVILHHWVSKWCCIFWLISVISCDLSCDVTGGVFIEWCHWEDVCYVMSLSGCVCYMIVIQNDPAGYLFFPAFICLSHTLGTDLNSCFLF